MARTYDEECPVDVEDDGLNGGNEGCGGISMTVWYVIIGVIAVALIIVLVVCLTKKKKKKNPKVPAGAFLTDDESIKLMQDARAKINEYTASKLKGSAHSNAKLTEEAEKLKQYIKDIRPQAEKVPEKFPARETFIKLLDNQEQLADLDEKYYGAKGGYDSQDLLEQIGAADKEGQTLKRTLDTQLAEAEDARRRSTFSNEPAAPGSAPGSAPAAANAGQNHPDPFGAADYKRQTGAHTEAQTRSA